jgi:hypothetical protein
MSIFTGEKCSWGLYHPVAISTLFDKEPGGLFAKLGFDIRYQQFTPLNLILTITPVTVYRFGDLSSIPILPKALTRHFISYFGSAIPGYISTQL